MLDEDLDPPVDETDDGPQPVIIVRDGNDEPRKPDAKPPPPPPEL